MRCSPAFIAALLATVSLASTAWAQNTSDDWNGGFGERAERRSDVVFGAAPSLMLGASHGYPNEIEKIDQPQYEAKSGFTSGIGFEGWVGVALKDWFTFGVGGVYLGGYGKNSDISGGAGLVRVEVFPLYGIGLKDLAVFAHVGAGSLTLHEGSREGQAGFASVGGGGVAYELARFGHFAFAPSAEYLLVASQAMTAHQVLIGARVVFYGGPG
jgi:hypothetical protein